MSDNKHVYDICIVTIGLNIEEVIASVESTRWLSSKCGLEIVNLIVIREQHGIESSLNALEGSIKVCIQRGEGISDAFNCASSSLYEARYVLYLNGGDRLVSLPSEYLIGSIRQEICSGMFDIITYSSRQGNIKMPPRYVEYAYRLGGPRFICARIPHQSTFIKTELMRRCFYNIDLKIRMDYDMFYRQLSDITSKQLLSTVLCEMEPNGISSNMVEGYKEEIMIHRRCDKGRVHIIRVQLTSLIKKVTKTMKERLC